MTYQDIFSMLQETHLPVAYNFFETPKTLPYIIFTFPTNNDFVADNSNYVEIVRVQIELYTERKSIPTERILEGVLKSHNCVYEKSSAWIESESMNVTYFEMEILING